MAERVFVRFELNLIFGGGMLNLPLLQRYCSNNQNTTSLVLAHAGIPINRYLTSPGGSRAYTGKSGYIVIQCDTVLDTAMQR